MRTLLAIFALSVVACAPDFPDVSFGGDPSKHWVVEHCTWPQVEIASSAVVAKSPCLFQSLVFKTHNASNVTLSVSYRGQGDLAVRYWADGTPTATEWASLPAASVWQDGAITKPVPASADEVSLLFQADSGGSLTVAEPILLIQ